MLVSIATRDGHDKLFKVDEDISEENELTLERTEIVKEISKYALEMGGKYNLLLERS